MKIENYKPKENVTNLIGEQYKEWKSGDIILINAGTGSGKSYFIRNTLEQYADIMNDNILLLVNRKRLFDQTLELTKNSWRIKIETYQSIEKKIKSGNCYDFSPYRYIVCDESHYFTSDSDFNDDSEDSYQAITNANHAVRIFMSATGSVLFQHFKSDMWRKRLKKTGNKVWPIYTIKRDFSFIASLSFYTGEFANVQRLIDKELDSTDKIIYFSNSIEKIYELYMKHQDDSIFVCAESRKNKKYFKYVDQEEVKQMVETNKFDCRYLFTTQVLDNGFDLKDDSIKMIVCDIDDIDIMLQCIGRKRVKDKNDKVHIVLLNHTNKHLYDRQLSYKRKVEEVKALAVNVDELNKVRGKYGRKSNYMIYDVQAKEGKHKANKQFSHVKYLQAQANLERYKEMLDENREMNRIREIDGYKKENDAYMMYIANVLKQKKIYKLHQQKQNEELIEYLQLIAGNTMLTLADRKQLVEKMNVQQNGKILKSIDSLNSALKENDIPFYIKEFETSRIENGKKKKYKSTWVVLRLSDK